MIRVIGYSNLIKSGLKHGILFLSSSEKMGQETWSRREVRTQVHDSDQRLQI